MKTMGIVLVLLSVFLLAGSSEAAIGDLPEGAWFEVSCGRVILESYTDPNQGDYFWVGAPDRSKGIRVKSEWYAWEGNVVSLLGRVYTTPAGDRELHLVDGATLGYGFPVFPQVGVSQKMLTTGLLPESTLTRVWGKVVQEHTYAYSASDAPELPSSWFYLDDGSGLETDDPSIRGLKVYDPYQNFNSPVVLGEMTTFDGVMGHEKTTDSKIIPVFYRSTNGFYWFAPEGEDLFHIYGTVEGGPDAAGTEVRVFIEGGREIKVVLDENGSAPFELPASEGTQIVWAEAPGYLTFLYLAYLDGWGDYYNVILPLSPSWRQVCITPSDSFNNEGEDVELTLLLVDSEARPLPDKPITLNIDHGIVISSDAHTDGSGRARARVRASSRFQVATVKAEADGGIGYAWIQQGAPGDPQIRLNMPWEGAFLETPFQADVSERQDLNWIRRRRLLVDGAFFAPYKTNEAGYQEIDISMLSNGAHSMVAEARTAMGIFKSNEVHIRTNSPISEFKINPKNGWVDDASFPGFDFRFNQEQLDDWEIEVWGYLSPEYAEKLWSQSGVSTGQIAAHWDGKMPDGSFAEGVFAVSFKTGADARDSYEWIPGSCQYISASRKSAGALICGQFEGEPLLNRWATWAEMNAIKAACKLARLGTIQSTLVVDWTWDLEEGVSSRQDYQRMTTSLADLLPFNPYRYFYLTSHGYCLKEASDGKYHSQISSGDGEAVYGMDWWDFNPDVVCAFSDLHLEPEKLRIVQINACYSAGRWDDPYVIDYDMGRGLGCRNSEVGGATFIGWLGRYLNYFEVLKDEDGWHASIAAWPNGTPWTCILWDLLSNGYVLGAAVESVPNYVYASIHKRRVVWGELSSYSCWLQP